MSAQPAKAATEAAPPRRLRWWGVLLIVLGVLLALFLLYRLALEYRVGREYASLRAEGYPTNLAEIDGWRGPPPAEGGNGGELYRRAFGRIVPIPDEDQEHHPISGWRFEGPLGAEERLAGRSLRAIADDVERNAEAIELLHRAADSPQVRLRDTIPSNADLMWGSLRYQDIRSAANLLIAEAMLHAERDDPAGTASALRAAWQVGNGLREEPFLFDYRVRIAIHTMTARQINRALHHTRFTDEQLTMLIELLDDEDEEALRRAMIADLALGLHYTRDPRDWLELFTGLEGAGLTVFTGLMRAAGLTVLNELTYVEHMRALIDAAALDWPERLDAARATDDALAEAPALSLAMLSAMSHSLLSFSAEPALYEGRTLASVRTARAGLAVERFGLAHGRLPESLDDVAPQFLGAIPLDPFTGEPLKYKRLDTGYTIYSVGEDRTDDGGRTTSPRGTEFGPGSDITFTVAR